MKTTHGIVYLIYDSASNLYKIGMTKSDSTKRMKQLQTGNGTELQIVYTHTTNYPFRVETMLHSYFKSKQVLNEWYELNDDEVINFLNQCKKIEETIKTLSDNPFFSKNLR